ncbi:hypothetical protein CGRA01v4_07423 [Colletotrichum graminicola]|nr:hypothetical protein CGRA01v4_07423 [Colletotrichum graminicola]
MDTRALLASFSRAPYFGRPSWLYPGESALAIGQGIALRNMSWKSLGALAPSA